MKPKRIELHGPGWRSGPVVLATGPVARWRGVREVPRDQGLLLRTRSVHGFGMGFSIWAIPLDAEGRAGATRLLAPGRVALALRARWFLELPLERRPPAPGCLLRVRRLPT